MTIVIRVNASSAEKPPTLSDRGFSGNMTESSGFWGVPLVGLEPHRVVRSAKP